MNTVSTRMTYIWGKTN